MVSDISVGISYNHIIQSADFYNICFFIESVQDVLSEYVGGVPTLPGRDVPGRGQLPDQGGQVWPGKAADQRRLVH